MPKPLKMRVERAADAVLARQGCGGPLELFQELRLLAPSHVAAWQRGTLSFPSLEKAIQVGPRKFEQIVRAFTAWAQARGLQPLERAYLRQGAAGVEALQVTEAGAAETERFYRTQWVPATLSEPKASRLKTRLNRPPDLVVFQKVSEEGACSECGRELCPGDWLLVERGQPLCLACADLDHLVFLPAGDTALTRRARKHSSLAAVVVRFSRARKRYERQGLLVTEAALARAEQECAAARARAATARAEADQTFIVALTEAIGRRYPGCPPDEARRIAAHTGRRHSGRVGRSAAGRALDEEAIDLAVIAHVRHAHTHYDELLMGGMERPAARAQVRQAIRELLRRWAG